MASMRLAMGISTLLLFLGPHVLVPPLRADEALLRDGKRTPGKLSLSATGRLEFNSKGKNTPLSWETIEEIQFASSSGLDAPLTGLRRVHLSGEQTLTGGLLGWEKNALNFRPLGMERHEIALPCILCVRHVPGFIAVVEEDFTNGLKAWKTEGEPALVDTDKAPPSRTLRLNATGQRIERALADSFPSGKVGVDFALPDPVAKGRWLIELDFIEAPGPTTVQFALQGDGRRYKVETSSLEKDQPSPICKSGRHRLWIEFTPNKTLLFLDDLVLAQDKPRRGERSLRALRFLCADADGKGQSSFLVHGVNVARAQEDPKRPAGSSDQDEVWLPSGDQLFGRIMNADPRQIELETRGRRHTLAWSEVLGFHPRASDSPSHTHEGEWVRVWLETGAGSVWDELEGVLAKLDENRLMLRHPALGELAFDRSRLHRLRRLYFGQRIELDNGFHHLGDKERPLPAFQPARAEGLSITKAFRLENVPSRARFIVSAVQLKGASDGIGPALERGELRTEVWMNNERVDYLNRLVDRAEARPQKLAVTIPAKLLRTGENVLEIRQTPEAATKRYENCGVSELVIETEP